MEDCGESGPNCTWDWAADGGEGGRGGVSCLTETIVEAGEGCRG